MSRRSSKQVSSEHLSPAQVAALEEVMDEGVSRGLITRSEREFQYVDWRYEAPRGDFIVMCYQLNRKKRYHSVVTEWVGDLGPLARAGRWDEYEVAREIHGEERAAGWSRSARARLRVLDEDVDQNAPHAVVLRTRSDLTPQQAEAYDRILAWLDQPSRPVLTLGGYAGTGKSTLVAAVANSLDGARVAFCAPTGKAAIVLREKLRDAGVDLSVHDCGTIHSLIYSAAMDRSSGRFLGFERCDSLEHDLLIVDEASMVDETVYKDLVSFGVPILAVGDHGQLPPVRGSLNLMASPELRLTEIHRQAEGSPIVRLSAAVRAGRDPMAADAGVPDEPGLRRVRITDRAATAALLADVLRDPGDAMDTAVLCYTNRTRVWLNGVVREVLDRDGDVLTAGDVVVCLRNTYFERHLLANGSRGVVEEITGETEHHVEARVRHPSDGYEVEGELLREQFGREDKIEAYDRLGFDARSWDDVGLLYDHGYAFTVHKSQGSQFRRVVLILERSGMDAELRRRWLYTGITRAVEELILVTRD